MHTLPPKDGLPSPIQAKEDTDAVSALHRFPVYLDQSMSVVSSYQTRDTSCPILQAVPHLNMRLHPRDPTPYCYPQR